MTSHIVRMTSYIATLCGGLGRLRGFRRHDEGFELVRRFAGRSLLARPDHRTVTVVSLELLDQDPNLYLRLNLFEKI